MKSISRRIISIFEKHYMERAEDRIVVVTLFAHAFLASLDYDVEGYYFDDAKVIKAVESYFLDVIKYKEYHFDGPANTDVFSDVWTEYVHVEKKINDSKVAAFSAKWLLKASPIYVVQKKGIVIADDLFCHINELFVLNCVLYALLQDDYNLVDEDEYKKLFYDFKYRNLDERAYFSRFELIQKNVQLKKELKILGESAAVGEYSGKK
jgi:hypothetical protein